LFVFHVCLFVCCILSIFLLFVFPVYLFNIFCGLIYFLNYQLHRSFFADDIEKMEKFVEELEICKKESWDQIIFRSIHYYHERSINLNHRGISFILDFDKEVTPEVVKKEQDKLEKLRGKFNEQRKLAEDAQKKYKEGIEHYTNLVSTGKQASKEQTNAVQKLKESLRVESDKWRNIHSQVQRCREQLRISAQDGMNQSANSFNVALAGLLDERRKLREENGEIVAEEVKRMKIEVEHEAAVLKLKHEGHNGDTVPLDDAVELAKLRAEKAVLTTQLEILRSERQRSDDDVAVIADRHTRDGELQRLQNLQIFRSYRKVCDDYKSELEVRWRALLDDAIKDAVYLNARNQDLVEKNSKLLEENLMLNDKLSTKPKKDD